MQVNSGSSPTSSSLYDLHRFEVSHMSGATLQPLKQLLDPEGGGDSYLRKADQLIHLSAAVCRRGLQNIANLMYLARDVSDCVNLVHMLLSAYPRCLGTTVSHTRASDLHWQILMSPFLYLATASATTRPPHPTRIKIQWARSCGSHAPIAPSTSLSEVATPQQR